MISLLDHDANQQILLIAKLLTPSADIRGLGGTVMCRMLGTRLPKLMLHGQVAGPTVVENLGLSGLMLYCLIHRSTS